MSGVKISAMPEALSLNAADLFPIVRIGSPNENYTVTATEISAFIGGGSEFEIVSKTGNYQIMLSDNGVIFDNYQATGPITLSLPEPQGGFNIGVMVSAAFALAVTAENTDQIFIGTASSSVGGSAVSQYPYSFLRLLFVRPGVWVSLAMVGTWALE